jgi:hypothetical protein
MRKTLIFHAELVVLLLPNSRNANANARRSRTLSASKAPIQGSNLLLRLFPNPRSNLISTLSAMSSKAAAPAGDEDAFLYGDDAEGEGGQEDAADNGAEGEEPEAEGNGDADEQEVGRERGAHLLCDAPSII